MQIDFQTYSSEESSSSKHFNTSNRSRLANNKSEGLSTFDVSQFIVPSIDNLLLHLRKVVGELEESQGGISKEFPLVQSNRKTFQNELHEYKYIQKRLVAKSFCNWGYGTSALQKQIGEYSKKLPINIEKYEIIVRTVVTQAYRKMEMFLIDDCLRDIEKLKTPQEMAALYNILLNCRNTFSQKQHATFCSFLQIIYELGSVLLLQTDVLKLYISILSIYQKSTSKTEVLSNFSEDTISKNSLSDKEVYFTKRGNVGPQPVFTSTSSYFIPPPKSANFQISKTNQTTKYFIPPPPQKASIATNQLEIMQDDIDLQFMSNDAQNELLQGLQYLKSGINFDNESEIDVNEFEIA